MLTDAQATIMARALKRSARSPSGSWSTMLPTDIMVMSPASVASAMP